jgi:hypothetical protein
MKTTVGRLLKGQRASLFVSQEVFDFIKSFEYIDKDNKIVNKAIKKLRYFADKGFMVDRLNIRPEGDGVFRIEIENKGRIIGFYDNKNFIGIECYEKQSTRLSRIQRNIIKKVKKIYANGDWIISINQ